jgi:hypothetical protein
MKIAIRRERDPRVCPYCRDVFAGERRVECRECGAAHHRACWTERPLCAACECPLARDDRGAIVAGLAAHDDEVVFRPRIARRSRARAALRALVATPVAIVGAVGGAIAWIIGETHASWRERQRR